MTISEFIAKWRKVELKYHSAAQALAGHADPKTTRRCYAHVQKGRVLREMAAALDLGTVGAYARKGEG